MDTDTSEISTLDFQKEGIKLIKNSKGYNWEMKTLAQDNKLSNADIDRLILLNQKLVEAFP